MASQKLHSNPQEAWWRTFHDVATKYPRERLENALTWTARAQDILPLLPASSVDLCIADPPYFLDGLGSDWHHDTLARKSRKAGVIGRLPVGMKFGPQQGHALQAFMEELAGPVWKALRPGGFFLAFSQGRLYHRLAVALENQGFDIRDLLIWHREGQTKAFKMDHFVKKMPISDREKADILAALGGRKTPQLRPQSEPIVLAQKPREGTFVHNWLTHGTGLIDPSASLDGLFPGTVLTVPRPTRTEKGENNTHLTVKPLALIRHLIQLCSRPGQVVLDTCQGSGTTGVAALQMGRCYLGIDPDPGYSAQAVHRMRHAHD